MNVTPLIQKIILSVVILAIFGYVVFNTLTSIEVPVSSDGTPIVTDLVGQDILILADKLETINIDRAIFSSPLFKSLKDNSVVVVEEQKGRVNPFSQIGVDSVSVSGTGIPASNLKQP